MLFFAGMLLCGVRRSVPVDGTAATAVAILAVALPRPNPLVRPALADGELTLAAARPLRRPKPRHDPPSGLHSCGTTVQWAAVRPPEPSARPQR